LFSNPFVWTAYAYLWAFECIITLFGSGSFHVNCSNPPSQIFLKFNKQIELFMLIPTNQKFFEVG